MCICLGPWKEHNEAENIFHCSWLCKFRGGSCRGFFCLGEGVALWSRVVIFLVKIYVLEIPQEHLQPSDSNSLFFLEEFSLNPTAIKGLVLNKDWRLRLCEEVLQRNSLFLTSEVLLHTPASQDCGLFPLLTWIPGALGTHLALQSPQRKQEPSSATGSHTIARCLWIGEGGWKWTLALKEQPLLHWLVASKNNPLQSKPS